MEPPLDLEGLLVALTLAPATFSRNRFFELYTDPAARRVHRRAKHLRSVVQHLGSPSGPRRVTITHDDDGRTLLAYTVPALGLTRTVPLDPLELVIVRFALGRGARDAAPDVLAALCPDPSDGPRIEEALSRLLPHACYEEASDPS